MQEAIGPSLVYTMGSFKTGQFFRSQLIGIPHHEDNRILVEFLGGFSELGKDYSADMALVAGLAGYIPGESKMEIRKFYDKIRRTGGFLFQSKIWPFTVDSDLFFNRGNKELPANNIVRFHLVNRDEKVLLQAEYAVSATGKVFGPGSPDKPQEGIKLDLDSFSLIKEVCIDQNLSLIDFIISNEKLRDKTITKEDLFRKMRQIWIRMQKTAKTSLGPMPDPLQADESAATLPGKLYQKLQQRVLNSETLGTEQALTDVYCLALAEESAKSHLIVAVPICETLGIVPAVLLALSQKYHCEEKRILEALLVSAFIGAILQPLNEEIVKKTGWDFSFGIATAMAAAAAWSLLSDKVLQLDEILKIAIKSSDLLPPHSSLDTIHLNLKHCSLVYQAVNLGLGGWTEGQKSFDEYFYAQAKSRIQFFRDSVSTA